MEIWHRRTDSGTTYVDVSGSLTAGYRILRQVISADEEIESNWQLDPQQSRRLLEHLTALVTGDALVPVEPEGPFDRQLMDALERLDPPARPVTFHSRD